MTSFQNDDNGREILLSHQNDQVMMEWERPYMEASIDMLNPTGHVLEIGFGCGYSATRIMEYNPKSYTVIECDKVVISRAKEWRKKYPEIKINILEGQWQERLYTMDIDIYDEIYFDDFPLNINGESTPLDLRLSAKRLSIFLDLCIQNHTQIGSKICWYSSNNVVIDLGSDIKPFVELETKTIDISIPENCKYRNIKEQKCTIPLLTKIKDYSFDEAQRCAIEEINKKMAENAQMALVKYPFRIGS